MTSSQRIFQNKDHLNSINVFPVADGDTGTNLAVTMHNIVEGMRDFRQNSFELVIQRIAKSALKGSRGNSGAILAQFFQGLAEATRGMSRLTTVTFSQAAVRGAEQAVKAIAEPREGTIITVMRDWAYHLHQLAQKTPDFVELFKKSLHKARKSLAETPEKLAILKQAGVVDAGAAGFVNLLEGIVDFIEFGRLRKVQEERKSTLSSLPEESFLHSLEKAQYRYCTECLLEGNNLNRELIRETLIELGDSQVVAGSEEEIRVHIHTNEPEVVFSRLSSFGTIVETKIDDMWEQANLVKEQKKLKKVALVADSTCDLPEELIKKYDIRLVPVTVQVEGQSFLDRVDISPAEVVNLLENTSHKIYTSQPPYQYFEDTYNRVGEEYENILSFHIPAKLSGTYQTACTAARQNKYHDRIQVIDSNTSTIGLGIMVLHTARLTEIGASLGQLKERLDYSIKNNRIFISLPTLKYLMRSGRLDRLKGIIGSMIQLKPILTLSKDGDFEVAAKVIGLRRLWDKTLELACRYAESIKNPCFGIAHVQDRDRANWYKKEIEARFPEAEIYIAEGCPGLSVHIGRGGAAIAVMGR
jgi:DAK2 domain fusion protein YloV